MIIAEVGSNHDGSREAAREYVCAAKQSGADAVKFQFIRKDLLISPKCNVGNRQENYPPYAAFPLKDVPDEWIVELKTLADEAGIEFFCTPFSLEAVDILERVHVKTYKIASGDITFFPLLEKVAKTGRRVILATGASDLEDVRKAYTTLWNAGARDITLLHCVSNYPPKWEEMNLRAMTALAEEFQCAVGISDHTPGSAVPVAATALGGTVIEKHVTFDRATPGPDHPYAMTFPEFSEMVATVRNIRAALGDGVKKPTATELEKQWRMRRGIYDPVTHCPADSGVYLRPQHRP
jgi:sialic acid synthase SpsE